MADKNAFAFNFKTNSRSDDYQKIIIHQNHAIIKLLTMQSTSTAQTIFNNVVIDEYAQNITPLVEIKEKPKPTKKDDANSFW